MCKPAIRVGNRRRSYSTISAHKCLYRYTCTRPHSGAAIFQQVLELVLKELPGVVCYLDNNLITGKDDAENVHNLKAVQNRLQRSGLRLKNAILMYRQWTIWVTENTGDGLSNISFKSKRRHGSAYSQVCRRLFIMFRFDNYYGRLVQIGWDMSNLQWLTEESQSMELVRKLCEDLPRIEEPFGFRQSPCTLCCDITNDVCV